MEVHEATASDSSPTILEALLTSFSSPHCTSAHSGEKTCFGRLFAKSFSRAVIDPDPCVVASLFVLLSNL
jgi:hypothetical protein